MRYKRSSTHLPLTVFQIAMNAAETVARRSWMMASGRLSPAEYHRMFDEKIRALQQTGMAMVSKDPSIAKLLKPWDVATRRNAKRLRRSKR